MRNLVLGLLDGSRVALLAAICCSLVVGSIDAQAARFFKTTNGIAVTCPGSCTLVNGSACTVTAPLPATGIDTGCGPTACQICSRASFSCPGTMPGFISGTRPCNCSVSGRS